MIEKIDLCFDMAGCPNRCKHCWIKTEGKGFVKTSEVKQIAADFKEIARELGVYSWYLEPDFLATYKELWSLEQELSTTPHAHFELLSDWRIQKDANYLDWAYEIGVRTCQLTFFGMEAITNKMTGRPNAFNELIDTIFQLIEKGISPRIQLFLYNSNLHEIQTFLAYISSLGIKEKCGKKGLDFNMFAHTGSCLGAAANLYDEWLTKERISEIPLELMEAIEFHYQTKDKKKIFGETETNLQMV